MLLPPGGYRVLLLLDLAGEFGQEDGGNVEVDRATCALLKEHDPPAFDVGLAGHRWNRSFFFKIGL